MQLLFLISNLLERFVLWEGHLADKSGTRVGHLNTVLARGAEISNAGGDVELLT